MNIGNLLNNI